MVLDDVLWCEKTIIDKNTTIIRELCSKLGAFVAIEAKNWDKLSS
jgi:hypothetical protein